MGIAGGLWRVKPKPFCVGVQWELPGAVGTQWELWRVLARTDQRLGGRDAFVGAHVDRRFPRGAPPSGCFSNQNWQ
jgi:hypothetical protein